MSLSNSAAVEMQRDISYNTQYTYNIFYLYMNFAQKRVDIPVDSSKIQIQIKVQNKHLYIL